MVRLAAAIGSTLVVATGGIGWAATGGASQSVSLRAAGPAVRSGLALVLDAEQGQTLYAKHADQVAPIASITKLMTAMVVLDAGLSLDEPIVISRADVDMLKHSTSRLPVGARLARGELLQVALMSSDNRAASALARTYPGGTVACVDAMNRKARGLGMPSTHFIEPTGLSDRNVSSAQDLARLVQTASGYPTIRQATTSSYRAVRLSGNRMLEFHNTNRLVGSKTWEIGLSKTGYIEEAGRCLVMEAKIAARKVIIVLLNSWGKDTRLGDAGRIRRWMEATLPSPVTVREGVAAQLQAD